MSKGLLKRIIPFAVALILGLFVTSFFVTVAAPQFKFRRGHHNRKHYKIRQLENDNMRLREELRRQNEQMMEMEIRHSMNFENELVPPPPPMPVVPRRVR